MMRGTTTSCGRPPGRDVFLDNVFGSQDDWFKVPLLHQAARCDAVLAVSDLVREGTPVPGDRVHRHPHRSRVQRHSVRVHLAGREDISRNRLRSYCRALHGFLPDFVFTHVTRMVPSKGMWRDAKVLSHLARYLADDGGHTAVLFVLSTGTGTGRAPDQVHAWEEAYGWPSTTGRTTEISSAWRPPTFSTWSNRSTASTPMPKSCSSTSWLDRAHCGRRMPRDMSFADIRRGSDLEFGLSIYEPFGIAQLEALTHGAVCCISSACGCRGFVARVAAGDTPTALVVEADYISLPDDDWLNTPWDALNITQGLRDQLEEHQSKQASREILKVLARDNDERSRNLAWGQAASAAMGWDVVARDLLLPALHRLRTQA